MSRLLLFVSYVTEPNRPRLPCDGKRLRQGTVRTVPCLRVSSIEWQADCPDRLREQLFQVLYRFQPRKMPVPFPAGAAAPPFHIFIRNSCLIYSPVSEIVIFPCPRTYTFTKTNSEVICMEPEIRKIVTKSALFFGILAVSAAEMKLAAWRNAQNAPDAVTASAAQSPVIVPDAGHGIN